MISHYCFQDSRIRPLCHHTSPTPGASCSKPRPMLPTHVFSSSFLLSSRSCVFGVTPFSASRGVVSSPYLPPLPFVYIHANTYLINLVSYSICSIFRFSVLLLSFFPSFALSSYPSSRSREHTPLFILRCMYPPGQPSCPPPRGNPLAPVCTYLSCIRNGVYVSVVSPCLFSFFCLLRLVSYSLSISQYLRGFTLSSLLSLPYLLLPSSRSRSDTPPSFPVCTVVYVPVRISLALLFLPLRVGLVSTLLSLFTNAITHSSLPLGPFLLFYLRRIFSSWGTPLFILRRMYHPPTRGNPLCPPPRGNPLAPVCTHLSCIHNGVYVSITYPYHTGCTYPLYLPPDCILLLLSTGTLIVYHVALYSFMFTVISFMFSSFCRTTSLILFFLSHDTFFFLCFIYLTIN